MRRGKGRPDLARDRRAAELEVAVAVQRRAVGIPGRSAWRARSTMEALPSNRCAADWYDDM